MTLKSLLIGSAAILAAGTGAQAADLPTAEPVEYVRICDAFGAGFYYIPGSDTCLKISGRVRVDAHYVDRFDGDDDDDDGDNNNFFGIDRETNNFTTLARGNVRLDARTQTDFGLIRAFINLQGTVGPGSRSTIVTFEDEDFGNAARSGGPNYDASAFALDQAFIEITNDAGTFIAGHADSFFDFFGSNTFGARVGIDDSTTSQTLFGYNFAPGGFYAGIAIEDPASSGRRRDPGQGNESYEGQELPDLVARVGGEFGFGAAQIMGAVRHIHDKEGFEFFEGEEDDDLFGWAIGAGLRAEFGGFGFSTQVSYTEGMLGYVTNDPGGAGDFSTRFDADADEFGGENDTNSAFGVRAGVSAAFSERVSAFVDGSYTKVDSSNDDRFDYTLWGAAANVIFRPVSGLMMGPEIAYNHIDFDDDDDNDVDGAEGNVFSAMFRIQRDF